MGLDNGAKSRARRKHRDKCETVKGNTMREKLERLWQEATVLGSSHGTCIMPEREAAVRFATYYWLNHDGRLIRMASMRRRVYEPTGQTEWVDGEERAVMRSYYVCDAVAPVGGFELVKREPGDELVIIRGRKVPTPAPFKVDWR